MSQLKFDFADLLVNNKTEILNDLSPQIKNVANTREWYAFNGLVLSFEDAFADFVEYKMKWAVTDLFNKPFEEVDEHVNKYLLVDLFGEDFLSANYWEKL